jgi:hypothetical protein
VNQVAGIIKVHNFDVGLRGRFFAPVALARYIAEHIPDCVIKIIPGAGHAGRYSCVDEVMNTLVH